ncbi:hypothetical protein MNBD_BACTEROID07-1026 [hydrothermal vent metagenome]|uniref:Uncharacterized protein n=1 Tax=hydrothermal vent metagenome TaxID=652676 RepID=A0A3B0VED9_9ZZZZ
MINRRIVYAGTFTPNSLPAFTGAFDLTLETSWRKNYL